jgi:hypothetical protein
MYSEDPIIRLQLIRMSDNPDRNMKIKKEYSSLLNTQFKAYTIYTEADVGLCSDKT